MNKQTGDFRISYTYNLQQIYFADKCLIYIYKINLLVKAYD